MSHISSEDPVKRKRAEESEGYSEEITKKKHKHDRSSVKKKHKKEKRKKSSKEAKRRKTSSKTSSDTQETVGN